MLEEFAGLHSHVTALRNDVNLGYTATVNRACQSCKGDIILLNSDTVVTEGWIEKLAACAYSRPRVATVTALSNAAGAFSIPTNNQVNVIPESVGVDGMARLVEKLTRRIRPEAPTGNGFCFYITRNALREVGLFDVKRFPKGYGEENDFCLRASALDYVHLVDDSTYIAHERTASFGASKDAIIAASKVTLRALYPEYKPRVEAWIKNDPLEPWREEFRTVLERLVENPMQLDSKNEPPCLLYVLHDGGGGTILTSTDLALALSGRYRVLLLKTALYVWTLHEVLDGTLTLIERIEFSDVWHVRQPLGEDRRSVLASMIKKNRVGLVHFRHFLANGPEAVEVIKEKGLPVILSFHDFYTACPTIQLIDNHGVYCGGKCTAGEGECAVAKNWFRDDLTDLKHHFVHQFRDTMRPAIATAEHLITTSESARSTILDNFPEATEKQFAIIEHGRDLTRSSSFTVPSLATSTAVVCSGALAASKGLILIDQLLILNQKAGYPFTFHFLGKTAANFRPQGQGFVVHGEYARDEFPLRMAEIRPSFAMIASSWPETYCHTMTEAWACGIPVIASNIGTLRERMQNAGGGWLLEQNDPIIWFQEMSKIRENVSDYLEKQAAVAQIHLRTIAEMADDYDAIYQKHIRVSV